MPPIQLPATFEDRAIRRVYERAVKPMLIKVGLKMCLPSPFLSPFIPVHPRLQGFSKAQINRKHQVISKHLKTPILSLADFGSVHPRQKSFFKPGIHGDGRGFMHPWLSVADAIRPRPRLSPRWNWV